MTDSPSISGDAPQTLGRQGRCARVVVLFDGSRTMAAGVTSKLWEISDMLKVFEDWELARISVTKVLTK
jgi:hypothetical protein